MEHRQPGPDDTKNASNLHAARAEGIAAWLHSRRSNESQRPKDFVEDDEEEEEQASNKRQRHLKLSILPISLEEGKESPLPTKHDQAEATSPAEGDHEHDDYEDVRPLEAQAESVGVAAEAEGAVAQHDALSEAELATLRDHEEDFRLWEEELRSSSPEVGTADMQMSEEDDDASEDDQAYIPRQRTSGGGSASTHHQSRRHTAPRASVTPTASSGTTGAKYKTSMSPPPMVAAGGGGGAVPPMPPGGGIAMGPGNPNGPFGPNNPNVHNVFNSPNILVPPATPNVLTGTKPNKINDHEHKHGHPRLALAMAAGLVVEHMVGKAADKRNEKASRERDQKLNEQITRNKAVQEQAQQSLEARLSAEQTRQRQAQAAERVRVDAIERTVATARAERVQALRPIEVANTNVDTEVLQHAEHGAKVSREVQSETEARSKIVMEQVAAAAESDQPVERVYERRQEVKDEPSSPAGAASGGAASIGSVLAKQNPTHQGSAQASQDAPDQQAAHGSSHDQGIDYHAAAIRGVGAGIAVIVLALMAYLLL